MDARLIGKVNAEVGRRVGDDTDRKEAIASFVEREGLELGAKKEDIEAVADLFIQDKAEAAVPKPGHALLDPELEASLNNYRIWLPPKYRKHGFVAEESPHAVGNVPPDHVVCWARHPDKHALTTFATVQAKGYRPVHPREVTSDPSDTRKLYVKQYVAEGKYVVVGDVVLMIALKEWQEGRYAWERAQSADRVDPSADKDKALPGMEVEATVHYEPMRVGG